MTHNNTLTYIHEDWGLLVSLNLADFCDWHQRKHPASQVISGAPAINQQEKNTAKPNRSAAMTCFILFCREKHLPPWLFLMFNINPSCQIKSNRNKQKHVFRLSLRCMASWSFWTFSPTLSQLLDLVLPGCWWTQVSSAYTLNKVTSFRNTVSSAKPTFTELTKWGWFLSITLISAGWCWWNSFSTFSNASMSWINGAWHHMALVMICVRHLGNN